MNVCIISGVIPPDYTGAGKRAYRHALYLKKKGNLFGIITLTNDRPDGTKGQEVLNEELIYRISVNLAKDSAIKMLYNILILNVKILFLLIKNRNKIDIIHSFGGIRFSWGLVLFSKLHKKQLINEFTLFPDFNKKSSHWSQKHRLRLTLNNSSHIVCISKRLQEWCNENGIKPSTTVIHNDTDFTPSKKSRVELRKKYLGEKYSDRSPVLLFLGPKTVRKGFDIVMETFDLLLQDYPNALLMLLGLSVKTTKINGKTYNIKNYEEKNLILDIGLVDNPEPYYQIADIALFPSRREGFGNVIIESMATKTPVIASRIQGITDNIITNGIDGFVIDKADNPIEYYNRTKEILCNKELFEIIQKNGVSKVQKHYSTEVIMNQYLELYKKLLAINDD